MQDEKLFTIAGTAATAATPITLADAGLFEREHLQEWVVANPDILGDDICIVTFEFDRWFTTRGSDPRDRLDVLALDGAGTLVVAELKRDRAAATVEMQALKYAAMVSRFDPDTLAHAHAAHLTRYTGEIVTADEALIRLEEHAGGPLDTAVLLRPRIVLVAGSFPKTTTATCVWLTEMLAQDTDPITLIRYQAYRTDNGAVLTCSQLWPIPEVDDFTVAPRQVEAQEASKAKQERRRATSAVTRLIATETLEPGTPLTLRATTEVDEDTRLQIADWVEQDPDRGAATWTGQSPQALRWAADGATYTPTGLVRQILNNAAGIDRGTRGTAWWVTDDGDDLVALADAAAPSEAGRASFDWTRLHQLLDHLEPGTWTTYGDLAEAVGTAAQPLGGHLKSCPDCPAGWRVLDRDGRQRAGFTWDDPSRTDTQQQALEAEGVRFDDTGRADPTQRMQWSAQGGRI